VVLGEILVTVHVLETAAHTFNDFEATPCHDLSYEKIVFVFNGQRPQAAPKVL
jgi:hypothetical protein